ncbi:MAG: DUF4236 domain-containing protein [Anaerolineales bacterium]
MPIYIRKAVRVGPFRFNISKSGVGVSVGVKGLRIGSGPRGNYIHAGRGGIYYRQTLGRRSRKRSPRPEAPELAPPPAAVRMREIDSGDVSEMVDSSSADLLQEINAKVSAASLLPFALGASLLALPILLVTLPPPLSLVAWAGGAIVLLIGARLRDLTARSVVLLYDLEPEVEKAYEKLVDSFEAVSHSARLWHVPQAAAVAQTKYQGGAKTTMQRDVVTPRRRPLPSIKANIDFPVLPAGSQLLAFTPERLLVFEGNAVGAVPYKDVKAEVSQTRFVEEGDIPRDAEVVDRTWRYVDKEGGPDDRFRDNPEIPVALYEEIHLTSPTGLNELFHVSKVGAGKALGESLRALSAALEDGRPD